MRRLILIPVLALSTITLPAQWVTFPVVFHVLYGNAQQNIPDSVLQHQLDVLNEDYQALNADLVNVPAVWQPIIGNMNIGFEFATTDPQGNPSIGIERRAVPSTQITPTTAHSFAQGGLDPWPDTAYLNIWVYNWGVGFLAYSPFPDSNPNTLQYLDLHWLAVGRNDPNNQAPYNKGRSATHELGHFFGLRHIWGDDGSACSGDDGIPDTPNQAGETYGCYSPGTILSDACTPTADGKMWMNFLDYTDDACMCFFTQGQVVEMTSIINSYYMSFLGPAGIHHSPGENFSSYNVFPSPSATGIFQVNRSDYNTTTSVEVYDLQGRMIVAPAYFENGSTTLQLDLSSYAEGVYTIVIRSDAAVENKRVIIAR